MADTPNLRVKISAEFAELKVALANIQQQLKGVGTAGAQGGREATSGLAPVRGIADEITGKVKALAALIVTVKLGEFAHSALDTAENIGHIAQKTGATTEQLSAMRVAIHGNDEEFDLLSTSLARLAKEQDKAASGNKESIKTFERLGISLADIKSKNPGDLFLEIAQKLSTMEAGSKRAALAQELFGKAGANLIPIMRDLANGGFEEARKKAEALGILLSKEMTEDADDANDAIDDLKLVAEGMANSFLSKVLPAVTDTLKGIRSSAEGDGVGAVQILGQAAAGVIQTITSLFSAVGKVLGATVASATTQAGAVRDILADVFTFRVDAAQARMRAAIAQQKRLTGELLADLKGEASKVFDAFAGNLARPPSSSISEGGGGTDGDGGGNKLVKGIVDQAQLAADAIRHELDVLKQEFDDGLISIDKYFERKLELQRQSIDAQIEQAQAEAKTATSSDAQSRALTKIVQLERDREQLGPAVEREKKKAVEDLTKSLDALQIRMLQLQGKTAEASRLTLEGEFKGLIQRLQAEGREAELATLRGFLDASVVKAQVSEFETRAQAILQTLHTAETSLGSQAAGGLLSPLESEDQIAAERDKALDKLSQLRGAVEAYYAATKDPTVLQFLQELTGEIGQVQAAQDQWRQQAQQLATDSVFNFLDRFAKGGIRSLKDLKAAFADMVLSFVQGLAKMAEEALAKRLIFSLFGAFGGGAGGGGFGIPLPGSGLIPGFVHHTGGIVGAGTVRRNMSPLVWANAPRFHSGGLIGPNERALIGKVGEEVVTEDNPRHIRNQQPAAPATYVLAFGEEQLADALAGHAGERVFLLHARNNPSAR